MMKKRDLFKDIQQELSKEKLEEITIEKNLYKGVEKIFYKGIINKRIRQLNKIDGIIYLFPSPLILLLLLQKEKLHYKRLQNQIYMLL